MTEGFFARLAALSTTWGSTPAERATPQPCDALIPGAEQHLWRAIDVAAPAAIVFRWVCQLRIAPYSYDLLDNLGRTSPRTLTPGLEALEVGQPVMTIFDLAAFEPGVHLTLTLTDRLGARRVFGDLAITYRVTAAGSERSRLLVKVAVRPPRGVGGALGRRVLPWGDLLMMQKQLRTLKRLAEATSAAD